jgi:hypothetical protein
MPKRAIDAGGRIFFDELVSVSVSRLRASGAIRLEDRHGIIAFGDKQKLVGVAHTKFPNGGSWSFFICPRCGGRKKGQLASVCSRSPNLLPSRRSPSFH